MNLKHIVTVFALTLLAGTAMAQQGLIQQRDQILRLRYNQEMSGATSAAQRSEISDRYRHMWSDNDGETPSFDKGQKNIDKALNMGDSSYAKSAAEAEVSASTLAPTLDYFQQGEATPGLEGLGGPPSGLQTLQ